MQTIFNDDTREIEKHMSEIEIADRKEDKTPIDKKINILSLKIEELSQDKEKLLSTNKHLIFEDIKNETANDENSENETNKDNIDVVSGQSKEEANTVDTVNIFDESGVYNSEVLSPSEKISDDIMPHYSPLSNETDNKSKINEFANRSTKSKHLIPTSETQIANLHLSRGMAISPIEPCSPNKFKNEFEIKHSSHTTKENIQNTNYVQCEENTSVKNDNTTNDIFDGINEVKHTSNTICKNIPEIQNTIYEQREEDNSLKNDNTSIENTSAPLIDTSSTEPSTTNNDTSLTTTVDIQEQSDNTDIFSFMDVDYSNTTEDISMGETSHENESEPFNEDLSMNKFMFKTDNNSPDVKSSAFNFMDVDDSKSDQIQTEKSSFSFLSGQENNSQSVTDSPGNYFAGFGAQESDNVFQGFGTSNIQSPKENSNFLNFATKLTTDDDKSCGVTFMF